MKRITRMQIVLALVTLTLSLAAGAVATTADGSPELRSSATTDEEFVAACGAKLGGGRAEHPDFSGFCIVDSGSCKFAY